MIPITSSVFSMIELLRKLLNRLDAIGIEQEELYDTECRDRLSEAVFDGFVKPKDGFRLAEDFGLFSVVANQSVREAIDEYITKATTVAARTGLNGFHARLAALQNSDVESIDGNFYDDYFGYTNPDAFDASGNVIDTDGSRACRESRPAHGSERSMTLSDVILGLDSFDPEKAIFTADIGPTTLASVAIVDYDDEGMPPAMAQGMRYLLEVSLAREAIAVWSAWRGGREPTLKEKLAAIVYYAENDAYLPLEE